MEEHWLKGKSLTCCMLEYLQEMLAYCPACGSVPDLYIYLGISYFEFDIQ